MADTNPINGDLAAASARPDFSVIVPCFEEEGSLEEFHMQLSAALANIDRSFEIIYINDGSGDGTLQRLQGIFERDAKVTRLIDLARNAGQTRAMTAGIQHATGRDLVFMDCDLQINPADLGALIEKFDEGFDMVGGLRAKRHDHPVRKWISRIGNRVVSRILGLPMRDLGCNLRVLEGDLVRAFEPGPNRPLDPGMSLLCFRSIAEVPISHHPRKHGKSRWTWTRALLLYHNILGNMLPSFFPFVVGTMLLFLALLLLYLIGSWAAPHIFRIIDYRVLTPLLVVANMLLSLSFFLVLGEFVLHANPARGGPAYVIRRMWSRPWQAPGND